MDVQKSAIFGIRNFITTIIKDHQWCLFWASSINSRPSESIFIMFILILSSHVCISLWRNLFQLSFQTVNTCMHIQGDILHM